MSRALVRGRDARSRLPAPTLTIAAGRKHTIETILKAWLERKSKNTVRSYEQDLTEFALFVTRALAITPRLTVGGALQILFRQESPGAHEMVLAFAGLSPKGGPQHGDGESTSRQPAIDCATGAATRVLYVLSRGPRLTRGATARDLGADR